MVEGDTKVEQEYYDELTGKMISVNMEIRDHLYLRFLQRIAGALNK